MIPNWEQFGAGGPALMLALALATFASEDLACVAAGILVARGVIGFVPATLACLLGIFVGDMALVVAGRLGGRRLLKLPPLNRWISTDSLGRAENWFLERGPFLAFACRFMPGTRLPTHFAAGLLKAPFTSVTGWMFLACLIWTPLLVFLAQTFGQAASMWLDSLNNAVPVILAAAAAAWISIRLLTQLATWRGRRLLLCRWRRLTRWEFWPMWAVYPPVVAYILWLGLRHRSLTLFTAVNPGIGAGGGLVGESKSEILAGLAGSGNRVATWTLIPPANVDTRMADLAHFMEAGGLSWPVVLKPDVGERGTGVVIARDERAARAACEANPLPLIAQAYIPGEEFGLFYHRHPQGRAGTLMAITAKHRVNVRGDGIRTLEQLILADDRAVCMAPYFLKQYKTRLADIPDSGEFVFLSELGTHCRGALFLDGSDLATPALTAVTDQISHCFKGFYFGRYDVRTPSVEALRRGEFTVIELNGLTSEATSIYDPKHSLWHGWCVLCRQWRIAFSIGEENRRRGVRPIGLIGIWRLLRTT